MHCSKSTFKVVLFLFVFCYVFWISGLLFFMNGLIFTKTTESLPSRSDEWLKRCSHVMNKDICLYHGNKLQNYNLRRLKRVVVIIIDALRADFIPSVKYNKKINVSMPFTEYLLKNGSGISFVCQGFAPTVTLPRIKTLVTGTVSNFVDIILNFNAAELIDDNILKQASSAGMKSVFYGDNTWLKLFPTVFTRSEGTHSFFVSDFKEVDLNVSRHIKQELEYKDWNILILHFLGVDHIGHAYGPFSEHLSPKLIEMDEIIKYMHENLDNNSMIIVCGDHGMTLSGSHGGITHDELLTPLIFIRPTGKSVPSKDMVKIDQVDFAPTLSIILGLPIPVNNFGSIIPDVLKFMGFSNGDILHALLNNFLQVSNIYESYFPSKLKDLNFQKETIRKLYESLLKNDTVKNPDYMQLIESYNELLNNIKQDLLGVLSGYNDNSIALGLAIMWLSNFLSSYILFHLDYKKGLFLTVSTNKVLLSILSILLSVVIVSYRYFDVFLKLTAIFLLMFICQIFVFLKHCHEKKLITVNEKLSMFLLSVHALSLFSSSFIEEEHQIWYFFTCSVTVFICSKRLHFLLKTHSVNIKTQTFWNEFSSIFIIAFFILTFHRISSKWNQVGNKWQHLPDLSDWLDEKENVIYLRIVVVISQIILMFYFNKKLQTLNYTLFNAGLLIISIQKISIFKHYSEGYIEMILIPQAIYIFAIIILIISLVKLYSLSGSSKIEKIKTLVCNLICIWIILIETIGRAHNIPLIAIALLQELLLHKLLSSENFSISFRTICYFIMAMTSFSYNGNSNNLSTIDVFSGYTGIQSYQPVFVGFLLVCNTYSTLVLWLLLLLYRIVDPKIECESSTRQAKLIFLYLLEYKLIILSLYCIVTFLMRHHLFIYSVFLPKLIYESCHVALIAIMNIFVFFVIHSV